MKRLLAIVITSFVMALMLWTGLRRPSSTALGTPENGPITLRPATDLSGVAARIESLLEAARRGDVTAYLASFEGPLRARLARLADERGHGAFAADLCSTAKARKSHTLFDPEADGETEDSARIVLESTFADRIERQTYRLVRVDSGWAIRNVETARDRVPTKKLGAIASFQEPEGVPVTTDQTAVSFDPEEN
ncbi:MAG: hypothetical protein ACLQGP_32690 [Isosphaeraceae bacterium]